LLQIVQTKYVQEKEELLLLNLLLLISTPIKIGTFNVTVLVISFLELKGVVSRDFQTLAFHQTCPPPQATNIHPKIFSQTAAFSEIFAVKIAKTLLSPGSEASLVRLNQSSVGR
jgi:hypothetical protein